MKTSISALILFAFVAGCASKAEVKDQPKQKVIIDKVKPSKTKKKVTKV